MSRVNVGSVNQRAAQTFQFIIPNYKTFCTVERKILWSPEFFIEGHKVTIRVDPTAPSCNIGLDIVATKSIVVHIKLIVKANKNARDYTIHSGPIACHPNIGWIEMTKDPTALPCDKMLSDYTRGDASLHVYVQVKIERSVGANSLGVPKPIIFRNLDNTIFSDCELIAGVHGECKILAHRIILANASAVFSVMLTSNMKEAASRTIELPKVPGTVLQRVIDHIYKGWLPSADDSCCQQAAATAAAAATVAPVALSLEEEKKENRNQPCRSYDIINLFVVADMYELRELAEACVNNMQVTKANLVPMIQLAKAYHATPRINDLVKQYVFDNLDCVLDLV